MIASLQRISALVERQWVLIAGSWTRIVSLMYWPLVQIVIWGFIQTHVFSEIGPTTTLVAISAAVGAVLLWDFCWRSQLGFALAFQEEIWSRNLGQLFASPLRPGEFVLALMAMSLTKTVIAIAPAVIVAAVAFGFNLFSIGPVVFAFIVNLVVFGWAISLFASGMIARYGQGAQDMPWALMFGITPFAAIYYPVSALPEALRPIAYALPPSHIFEGLRAAIGENRFDAGELAWATGLNMVWLAAGLIAFFLLLRAARRVGAILQIGE